MTQAPVPQPSYSAADFDRTLILALEVSEKSWVVAAQVPGLPGSKPRRTLSPTAEALLEAVETYRARAARAGRIVDRVVLVYEAGYSGFWLARWLARHAVDTFVIQPSSVPVDRRVGSSVRSHGGLGQRARCRARRRGRLTAPWRSRRRGAGARSSAPWPGRPRSRDRGTSASELRPAQARAERSTVHVRLDEVEVGCVFAAGIAISQRWVRQHDSSSTSGARWLLRLSAMA